MTRIVLLTAMALGLYQAWQQFGPRPDVTPLFESSYVAVYGRKACGWTQQMRDRLQAAGVKYHYFSVDDIDAADQLHARMQASGLSTSRYNLPVVDVSGTLSIRPEPEKVIRDYRSQL